MNLQRGPANPVAQSVGSGYRPDIDGLRALAVISVVLYHINEGLMPGGFVGVDIFFVISGFLITRNIWSEISRGRFSLLNFYVRRIHRIYPAFAVMALATLLTGSALLLPGDMTRLARSAFWGAFSLPNVYFWKYLDTSYFAAATEEEPLLHTWSLGVEEQFYFLWPALLILMAWMFRKNRLAIVALTTAVAAFSFAYAQAFLHLAPKFTYYMLPARAGELMLGAILAVSGRWPAAMMGPHKGIVSEVLATAGLLFLVYSLVFINSSSDFPGVSSLWPCLGAVLLIAAGDHGSWISRRMLSLRPMVFVGLISYSLYLWHWPILAFIRYFYGVVSPVSGCLAIVLMLALAWLSYRYVEIPFRHWRPGPKKSLSAVWGMPLALIATFSFTLLATNGLKSQIERMAGYAARKADIHAAVAPAFSFSYVCQASIGDPSMFANPRCKFGATRVGEPKILLWGDSKAAQYVGLFDELGKRAGVSIRNAEHAACPPVFADGFGGGKYRQSCDKFWKVAKSAIASRSYQVIILGGSWGAYDGTAGFRENFVRTVDELLQTGARVVVLSDVPRYGGYNRSCLERSMRLPWNLDCGARATEISAQRLPFEDYLAEVSREGAGRVIFLDLKSQMCPGGNCRGWKNGTPLYFDEGHISLEGGRVLGRELLEGPTSNQWLQAIGFSMASSRSQSATN